MKRHLLGLCVLMISFASSSLLTPPLAYCVGAAQASIDILRGKHRQFTCSDVCMRFGGGNKFEKRLYQDYGIETVSVTSCMTNEAVRYRVRGYDDVQVPYMEALFRKENLESLAHQTKLEREAEIAAEIAAESK